MIYIHAYNLGLYHDLVNTLPLTDATAKDFSWVIRLSTQDFSKDFDVTVVEIPQKIALSLFWWYCNKEASDNLAYHLTDLLDNDAMKDKVIKQLEWSVDKLTADRNRKEFAGVVLTTAAEMANEVEDHIEYAHAKELYDLLDAKGFEKFCEVEA
jgi:hypothetical protein